MSELCDECVRRLAVWERANLDEDDDLVVRCTECGCRCYFSEGDEMLDCQACGADLAAQSSEDDCPGARSLEQLRAAAAAEDLHDAGRVCRGCGAAACVYGGRAIVAHELAARIAVEGLTFRFEAPPSWLSIAVAAELVEPTGPGAWSVTVAGIRAAGEVDERRWIFRAVNGSGRAEGLAAAVEGATPEQAEAIATMAIDSARWLDGETIVECVDAALA